MIVCLRFFTENSLTSQNQSGFKPGGTCTNQLLSITHQIYKSSDDGQEVRSVFLDMSKAFDKVWQKDLIFKLKVNGISGNLLSTLTDFLKYRKKSSGIKQSTVFMVQCWSRRTARSFFDLLLFWIYINHFSDALTANTRLPADDVSLFSVVDNINLSAIYFKSGVSKINAWVNQ